MLIHYIYSTDDGGAVDANNDLLNYLKLQQEPKSLANIIFTLTRSIKIKANTQQKFFCLSL